MLDFLNGKIPAFVDTTLNVVHVDDLAAGHLLALERGDIGRSYIVGGENMGMGPFLAGLADATGLPAPKIAGTQKPGAGSWSRLPSGRGTDPEAGALCRPRGGSDVDHQHDVQ